MEARPAWSVGQAAGRSCRRFAQAGRPVQEPDRLHRHRHALCRFFFNVMASLAEMERELIVERTRAGLDVARQLGRKGGRKRQMTDSKIESAKKLLVNGIPPPPLSP